MSTWTRPAIYGAAAGMMLLALYFGVLTLVSGWQFTLAQFAQFRFFVVTLAAGFGVQVALYARLRAVACHGGSGKVVAAAGGTSTAAMISCCAHYLVNVLPVLGAAGAVALVAQYQTELFWAGLLFNLAAMAYVGHKLLRASRHMSTAAHST